MAVVNFTAHLDGLAPQASTHVSGVTVADALDEIWSDHPRLKGYILDDQDRVRHHIAIFVDGELVRGQAALVHPVTDKTDIHVMQALSGGLAGG